MVVLTADVVHNRLQDIKSPTQEAIETMSLWIMHYKDKASIDLIVEGWLNCFKTGTENKRIALFYVMNDVVQKAKQKHADTLVPAFQPAVLTAVGIGRKDEKVKNVMKRCINIFKTRNVFCSDTTNAMENLLASDIDEGYEAEDQALEVDADDLIKKITNFVSARNVITDIMKFVNGGDFDYREKCRTKMRNREEGGHVLQEVHESIDTMVNVRRAMEDQKKLMMALSESLELAKRVFLHQKREVLVVEEAYVNFRDGIKVVREELKEMEEKGVYPGLLSPVGTDEEHPSMRNPLFHHPPPKPPNLSTSWVDNRNQIDMEMDDEERPQAPMMKPSLQALVGIASQPSLQSRIMQLGLKKIADGDEQLFPQKAEPVEVKPTVPVPSFQARPPVPPATTASVNQFAVPPPAIPPKLPSDPRIRQVPDSEGPSQYALALQQHGIAPPTQSALQNQMSVPPPVAPSAYQAQFETRDPRFLVAAMQHQQPPPTAVPPPQQPTISAYQAQFETRDPRIMQQQQLMTQTNYQASFEAQKPPLVSPQPQAGAYQARFESAPITSTQQHGNQYNHQQQAGAYRQLQHQQNQSQGYGDYHSGERNDDRFERRDDRGSYHNNRYEDRRNSHAPYSNPRSSGGGGDRWRNGDRDRGGGGGYNDRHRNDNRGRDSYRGGGGNRGSYNRY